MTTRDELREASSKRILEAALNEFTKHGYTYTKLSDIARQAQVAQSLISQRFTNKENLFCSVVSSEMEYYFHTYPSSPNHIETLFDFAVKTAHDIKATALEDNIHFEFMSMFVTSRDLPRRCMEDLKRVFCHGSFFHIFKKEWDKGLLYGDDPFDNFFIFLKTTVGITTAYLDTSIPFLEDENYVYLLGYKDVKKILEENQKK